MAVKGQIQPFVGAYFKGHPGQPVYLGELFTAAKGEFTEQQLQSAVNHLQRKGIVKLNTLLAGRCWSMEGPQSSPEPSVKAAPEVQPKKGDDLMFEYVGKTKADEMIIKSDNGILYKAVEL